MIGAHAPSPTSPRHARLVLVTLLIAVLVGGVATVLVWQGQDHEVLTTPQALPVPLRDGNVMVITTPTSTTLPIAVGQEVQFILPPGQQLMSSDRGVLQPIASVPCHIFPVCAVQGVTFTSFRARHSGDASVDSVSSCGSPPCVQTPLQRFSVALRPQLRPLQHG